jgi:hypothetical protein
MSVLDGPRRETRRVMIEGSAYWATPVDGGLGPGDGRLVDEARVRSLPPCEPTRILCVHTSFRRRVYEFTDKPPAAPSPPTSRNRLPRSTRTATNWCARRVATTSTTRAKSPAPRAAVGHQPASRDDVRRVALGDDERLPDAIKAAQAAASRKG